MSEFMKTHIKGLWLIQPTIWKDERGYFFEAYNEEEFFSKGLNMKFVQDNQSFSKRGVLRGLHYQKEHPQGKLVRCVQGTIYDVAVDLRPGSPTYKQHVGIYLSEETQSMLYIPEGFAHGFYTVSDAIVTYKCTDSHHPEDEHGIRWNEPTLNIEWPITPILSDRDKRW